MHKGSHGQDWKGSSSIESKRHKITGYVPPANRKESTLLMESLKEADTKPLQNKMKTKTIL